MLTINLYTIKVYPWGYQNRMDITLIGVMSVGYQNGDYNTICQIIYHCKP